MNRNVRIFRKLAEIFIAIVILTFASYYICSLIDGHQLAAASKGMAYSKWRDAFFKVTAAAGVTTFICSLIWFVLSHFKFKVTSSKSGGRRSIWAAIAILTAILMSAVTWIYAGYIGIKVSALVLIIFIILFVGIGYWLMSIVTTSDAFKYTPIGSQVIKFRG